MESFSATTSETVETNLPCPDCGSSDAMALYDDGHTHCFSCATTRQPDTLVSQNPKPPKNKNLMPFGYYTAIEDRRLSEKICAKFGYFVTEDSKGRTVQVAPYRNAKGEPVAQKARTEDKQFYTVGDMSGVQLFGQHLWKPSVRLVITEGEIDCMSYAKVTDGRWPVVSIPTGAASAVKAIKNNIEFVESFDSVILMFDMDDAGQKAAREVADTIKPGKASIASLSMKDANELLVANRVKELSESVYQASPHRPDGIVNGMELWDEVSKSIEVGLSYPWKTWNDVLFGLRPREVVTICAGSGVGKSTICAELAYKIAIGDNRKVGYVALEEGLGRTGLRMMSLALNKPIHLPNDITEKERRKAFDAVLKPGNFFFYDHFGSLDSDNLMNKLNYMVQALGVEVLVLDHLSILVSGLDSSQLGGSGDERKALDYTMTQLRSFTERTHCCLLLVSHLKRPQGDKGHEGGEKVYLSHLRGSAAIAQLSDSVISISRDMSSGEQEIHVSCLKNRYAGITGDMGTLEYNPETGRLTEVVDEFS